MKYKLGCFGLTFLIMAIVTIYIGILGNPLDATYLRVFKRCSGCRFEFSNADFRNADLAGANLKELRLYGRDFSQANLYQANLESISSPPGSPANFQGANLNQANMRDVYLPNTNFTDAQLEQTNLQNSDLTYANFTGASLRFANLTGAILIGAKLLNTDFRGANLTDAKICFLPFFPNLKNAIIKGATILGEFTPDQKRALKARGAIVTGGSENCYR